MSAMLAKKIKGETLDELFIAAIAWNWFKIAGRGLA